MCANAVLLASLSRADEFNYYTELMNLKDQWGRSLFVTIKIGLCCARCEASGQACTHRLTMNPHWKVGCRQREIVIVCD